VFVVRCCVALRLIVCVYVACVVRYVIPHALPLRYRCARLFCRYARSLPFRYRLPLRVDRFTVVRYYARCCVLRTLLRLRCQYVVVTLIVAVVVAVVAVTLIVYRFVTRYRCSVTTRFYCCGWLRCSRTLLPTRCCCRCYHVATLLPFSADCFTLRVVLPLRCYRYRTRYACIWVPHVTITRCDCCCYVCYAVVLRYPLLRLRAVIPRCHSLRVVIVLRCSRCYIVTYVTDGSRWWCRYCCCCSLWVRYVVRTPHLRLRLDFPIRYYVAMIPARFAVLLVPFSLHTFVILPRLLHVRSALRLPPRQLRRLRVSCYVAFLYCRSTTARTLRLFAYRSALIYHTVLRSRCPAVAVTCVVARLRTVPRSMPFA